MESQQVLLESTISEYEIDEPHYEYSEYHQTNEHYGFVPEEQEYLNVYSPHQPGLIKKASSICNLSLNDDDFELEQYQKKDIKRRNNIVYSHKIHKKARLEKHIEDHHSSTTLVQYISYLYIIIFQSFDHLSEIKGEDIGLRLGEEGELDKLINDINLECKTAATTPKCIRLPTMEEIQNHLKSLENLRYSPTPRQEEFLKVYLNDESMKKIKIGIDEDLLDDIETHKFEDWVEHLCTSTNHKSLKEMTRRQKVKNYLQKKHGRTYEKKVHYHIRQKVAEERLRVKGRFVTWTQALQMLNEENQNKKPWNYEDYFKIKKLLNEKFGACKSLRQN